jgi:hypothetical protein
VVSVDENKRLVARAVAEVINGGDFDAIDDLFAPEIAAAAQDWVAPFRAAFPDVRMNRVARIGEGDTVVGHFAVQARRRGRGWAGPRRAGPFATCGRFTGSSSAMAGSSTSGAGGQRRPAAATPSVGRNARLTVAGAA